MAGCLSLLSPQGVVGSVGTSYLPFKQEVAGPIPVYASEQLMGLPGVDMAPGALGPCNQHTNQNHRITS